MGAVRFVDTCVLLNLLHVPNMCQEYDMVMSQYNEAINGNDSFVIPLATIIETGNHIAHISNGDIRRLVAVDFVEYLNKACNLKDGWSLIPHLSKEVIEKIISDYPNQALQGVGIGDSSILQQFELYWKQNQPIGCLKIWS